MKDETITARTRDDFVAWVAEADHRFIRGEHLADRYIHYLGIVAAVIGAVVLIIAAAQRERALTLISVIVYCFGLLGMLGASAVYNMAKPSRRKDLLRRIDHAAIFLMIARTYTPLTLVFIGGGWGLGIAIFVWLVALIGIALKLFFPHRLDGLSTVLYLALGWTILVGLRPMFEAVPLPAILMLGAGGLLYSVGVIFHLWSALPYQKAIWHGFVLGAAACQWVAILDAVVRVA